MAISGGYGGHAWIAVVEAGVENALEIVDADIDAPKNTFKTVALPSAPKDVEILPLKRPASRATGSRSSAPTTRYDCTTTPARLKATIGGSPYMIGSALRLDIDDQHHAIHVLHQGTQSAMVTVYKWVG